MKRTTDNAFHRHHGPDTSGGALRLNPLRAAIRSHHFGVALKLSPMRVRDIIPVWRQIGSPANSSNLLLNLDQHDWNWRGRRAHLLEILNAQNITPDETFGSSALVLNDVSLGELLHRASTDSCSIVRMEGPVEALDVEYISKSLNEGRSALDGDLRATAAINIRNDRRIGLHTREQVYAVKLAGENFRQYVAALRREPASHFAAPPVWMVEYVIGLTGQIKVRPIETDANEESIDIGVSTPVNRTTGPARYAMIYDLPSHSWHFDEE